MASGRDLLTPVVRQPGPLATHSRTSNNCQLAGVAGGAGGEGRAAPRDQPALSDRGLPIVPNT